MERNLQTRQPRCVLRLSPCRLFYTSFSCVHASFRIHTSRFVYPHIHLCIKISVDAPAVSYRSAPSDSRHSHFDDSLHAPYHCGAHAFGRRRWQHVPQVRDPCGCRWHAPRGAGDLTGDWKCPVDPSAPVAPASDSENSENGIDSTKNILII